MDIRITPSPLGGEIEAISSKSHAHRLLICAALADGETIIRCSHRSRDMEATVACLNAMGSTITYENGAFYVKPMGVFSRKALLCGESGSTLRFLLPVVCALGLNATFQLEGRLPDRPMEPLWSELLRCGAVLEKPCREEISVSGKLNCNEFTIAADVSSQYISGLLFALPLMGGGTIHLTGTVESRGYITMTQDALSAFGVESIWEENTITVRGNYHSPKELTVEGDWSNAAFWLAADALSLQKVNCTGLNPSSSQGDKDVISAIEDISRGNAVIDASQIPDLVPILAVVAALSKGKTEFIHASRLRLKESDRLEAVEQMLTELGGDVKQTADGLIIWGKPNLSGGITHSRNDHRIAMSAAIASLGCENAVTVQDAEAVEKSYPDFWNDFARLGGKLEEVTP